MKTIFTQANVIVNSAPQYPNNGKILYNHEVWVENGKITRIQPHDSEVVHSADVSVINCNNQYLSAGFIDLHVHGGMGHDFMDGTKEAIEKIASHHASHGVTAMLATGLAASDEETFTFLDAYEKYAVGVTSCRYLGVHLEGPYFAVSQAGAQDPRFIRDPSPEHYKEFLRYGCIKRVSAAPERPGGYTLGRELRERGIIASMAHTEADYQQALVAYENGYTLVTHLYSAMTGVHRKNAYRHGGLIEATLLHNGLTAEIIADNRHLPECLLRLIYKCKGRNGIILASDAMRAAGYEDGQMSKLGSLTKGQDVIVEDGVAKMPDRQAFAGSVASGDRLVRTMVKTAGVPLTDAVAMMTVNPARIMGLADRLGDVREGFDADLIVFDGDINVKYVMVDGKL